MPANSSSRSSSVAPSGPPRKPKRLSESTSKKRANTTVSLIFGQGEQGAPLASAIEKLPVGMADDTASMRSYASIRKRESMDNVSVAEHREEDSLQTEVLPQIHQDDNVEQPGHFIPENPPIMEEPSSHMPISTSPEPEAKPAQTEPPKESPLPPKTFWFTALGSRGKEKAAELSTSPSSISGIKPVETASVPAPAPVPSVIQDAQSTPEHSEQPDDPLANNQLHQPPVVSLTPSEPVQIPREQRSNNSWFSSTVYSPPRKSTLTGRPPKPHTISISSIDEEVPAPRPTPPPPSPITDASSHLFKLPEERARTSSLSGSVAPARFTLRMPLLGRPKIPLDQAVAVAQAEDLRKATPQVDTSEYKLSIPSQTETLSEQLDQVQTVTVTTAESAAEVVIKIEGNPQPSAEEPRPQEHTGKDSSWLAYMGWSSSTSLQSAPPTLDATSTTTELTQEEAVTYAPTQPMPALHLQEPSSPVAPQSPQDNVEVQNPGKTASLRSADTASSAWYAPWTWHPSPAPTVPHQNADGAHSQHDKTESEIVKEEALARESSSEPPPQDESSVAIPEPASSTTLDIRNPIQSTILTNKSGWTSFFSSRAVKRIADIEEKKEEQMEVMEIEEEEEGQDVKLAADSSVAPIVKGGKPSPQPPSTIQVPKSPIPPPNKEREQKKNEPHTAPLPSSDSLKSDVKESSNRPVSPTPSSKKVKPPRIVPPNLVLPTWEDTFHCPPRSTLPPTESSTSTIAKTIRFVSGFLTREPPSVKGKERERRLGDVTQYGKELPRALDLLGEKINPMLLNGECKVVVIGVNGWSPGAVTRTIAGGLPSSSSKFVGMTCQALDRFETEHGVKFRKITQMPLEGDGTVYQKVEKVHKHLLSRIEWMDDLHDADVIFFAAHSQGSIVVTHLIDRLLREGHIRTSANAFLDTTEQLAETAAGIAGVAGASTSRKEQEICCLCLCGIHLGPLRYLKMSSFIQPYIQYFENAAAKEIFDFQDTDNPVSKNYVKALGNVMNHRTKMVYVASLNDQMVPVYSGLFTAASHPRILRALYIDGDAYHSSDFLSNLLVLLLRILNAGLSDSGLLTHLSEATAGSLSGVGHSTVYEEAATFSLAVKYQFLTNEGDGQSHGLIVEPFNAVTEQNDYEIPWSLRDLIANDRVAHFFSREFMSLRDAFGDWQPKTAILRDVKRKLQPIQRLATISLPSAPS